MIIPWQLMDCQYELVSDRDVDREERRREERKGEEGYLIHTSRCTMTINNTRYKELPIEKGKYWREIEWMEKEEIT